MAWPIVWSRADKCVRDVLSLPPQLQYATWLGSAWRPSGYPGGYPFGEYDWWKWSGT